MRRPRHGSIRLAAGRPAALLRSVAPAALAAALVLTTPGVAQADPAPAPDNVAGLIADVAQANQRLQDLGARIQTEQESVNKAIVAVQDARDAAETAQRDVETSRRAVAGADAAIAEAQKKFDTFAAASYMGGPTSGYLTAANPDEMVAAAGTDDMVHSASETVMNRLVAARTEQVNKESAARQAKADADRAVADAQASQDAAVTALTDAQRTFGEQQKQIDRLVADRDAAQARLDAARPPATVAVGNDDWDRAGPRPAAQAPAKWDGPWDPTLPAVPSAFVSGDPVAIINTVLGISQTSAQVTQDMGRKFLQKLGLAPTPTGYTNNGAIPVVYGRQASEYVIRRGMSQMGVPYSWGGGNAAGPSRGIDSGANTVGFDCSGLVLYAFAGVGIKLPHYSGSQYEMGRKIPSSQMRRGDVIFYGPGGSQHVTIYLGQGQMLEAPYTGSNVKISPVRTSGMTPYVVRYIEY
ncbi:NlpC/P60 family peptidoglycan endopeptidase RipA [Mycolicibacillus trivialis]|uniref:Peptidase M23 n=1 Tax=Mycolicibacillus trivialis TaxID=1798 RepID=A0A1X2EPH1_9MYCO|nr:NlpC/P60 family peptidoglycan endopeptidase RipA [Mycolicibacillus trivialis]ORX08009.1 peptidase M23 [Mycolicibacillus trivialis]